jgi:tRNA1Val (adenine37-N6)-methyltransferase
MKVGTDATLLGAWAEIKNAVRILDIGTGSGVIAVMLAQRSNAQIDAIDIHEPSCKDAGLNFRRCSWSSRLHCFHSSFENFINTTVKKYDLIVSNPPFHRNSLKSPMDDVNLARHETSLTHKELVSGVKRLLSSSGRFCLILPFSEYQHFIDLSSACGLHCQKESFVIPKAGKPVNRVLVDFGFQKPALATRSYITVRNSSGGFHEEYIYLTKDFYLHF